MSGQGAKKWVLLSFIGVIVLIYRDVLTGDETDKWAPPQRFWGAAVTFAILSLIAEAAPTVAAAFATGVVAVAWVNKGQSLTPPIGKLRQGGQGSKPQSKAA